MTEEQQTIQLIYDARGNGCGAICPTITGDHMGHANDYMAVVVTIYENYDEDIGDELSGNDRNT